MSRWEHRMKSPGEYVLLLDDAEVGTLTLLPEVRNQHVRVEQVVAAFTAIDEQIEHTPVTPNTDDFRKLGWPSRSAHDMQRRQLAATANGHPAPVRDWLKSKWRDAGFAWPLSPGDMDRWAHLVRTARDVYAQDRAAEIDAVNLALLPADEWVWDGSFIDPGLTTSEVAA
jgi:hypothetical protein